MAAGHARHLRWMPVLGAVFAVIGAAMLVATAFAPHTTWSSWLTPATFTAAAPVLLFSGFNARRAARPEHPTP